MSTELATTNSNPPASDGFDVEETGGNSLIRGVMLKFKDNDWLANKTEFLPAGTRVTAIGTTMAWVRWGEEGPPEHRVTESGHRHPLRDTLGDLNKDEWPAGLDGAPADPWRDTRYVYLVDGETAATYTFVTDSMGGRRAVSELKTQIQTYRVAHPNAVPIVELAKTTMPTKFGIKQRPLLKVTGWHIPPAPAVPQARAVAAAGTIKSDMDDSIPWAPEVR
jgi:hypothetical protein